MKSFKYFSSLILLSLSSLFVSAQCPTKVLHFEEEFDAAILSPADWRDNSFAWNKLRTRTWGKQDNSLYDVSELQYYTQYDDLTENPENNFILGYDNNIGKNILNLTITNTPIYRKRDIAKPNDAVLNDGAQNLRWWNYTAGEMTSKKRFQYGMYIMNAKFTEGRHLWPAFWLWGSSEYGNEIDMIEFEGHKPNMSPTNYHWFQRDENGALVYATDENGNTVLDDYGNPVKIGLGDQEDIPLGGISLTETYNRIGVVWLPLSAENDVLYFFVLDNADDAQSFSRTAFHKMNSTMGIQLNAALGGSPSKYDYDISSIPYTLDVTQLNFPIDFKIDYVKVYEYFECTERSICNYGSYPPLLEELDPVITGTMVTLGGNDCAFIVPGVYPNGWYGKHVDVIATQEIRLKNGFHAQAGSNFRARITQTEEGKQEDTLDEIFKSVTHLRDSIADLLASGVVLSNEQLNTMFSKRTSTQSKGEFPQMQPLLYPNPTTGLLTLTHSQQLLTVEVYDPLGRQLLQTAPNATTTSIDLSGQPAGIYIIRAGLEDGSTETHRVVLSPP